MPRFKTLREDLKRMANIDIFQQILVNNSCEAAADFENDHNLIENEINNNINNDHIHDERLILRNDNKEDEQIIEILDTPMNDPNNIIDDDDKTLNELLEQVAELDEIYTDHQIRRDHDVIGNQFIENELRTMERSMPVKGTEKMEIDDTFDDAATYSSLQKAFKNPIDIKEGPPIPQRPTQVMIPSSANTYDAVEPPPVLINPLAPMIDVQSLKRENKEEEKLPPLPPKRARKITETETSNKENNNLESPSHIIIKPADPPNKKLPPTPGKEKANQRPKKPGFFSKLFSRRKSKPDLESEVVPTTPAKTTPVVSREPSVRGFDLEDPNRSSFRSLKTPLTIDLHDSPKSPLNRVGKPLGRSASSVSSKRPNIGPEIIHIPLKGDSTNSLPMRSENALTLPRHGTPQHSGYGSASTISLHHLDKDRKTMSALQLADLKIKDGNMELVAIADAQSIKNLCEGDFGVKLDPNVDLTEAEHFALYTSVPPYATMSEIDENSMYYAPVEGGEILTPAEVSKRLMSTLNNN